MKNNIKISNLRKSPLTVCFSLFILAFSVLYFIFPDKEISEWENRYLALEPQASIRDIADGSFMKKYEDYINDQVPFRDTLIKLKAVAETMLLKVENNNIARGEDSQLFTKNTGDAKQFDKNIEIITQFVSKLEAGEAENRNVKIAIAPNACGVIKSKIPLGFPCIDQSEKLADFKASEPLLKGARVVDLSSALEAHEDEYIYYRTDHHWTSLGAYYAYCDISENPIDLSQLKGNSCEGFYGTLYAKYKGLFVKPDTISYYDIPVKKYIADNEQYDSIYDTTKLSEFDKYAVFMRGNFGRCEIETNTHSGKKAIIFKDSYANSVIPYLTFDYENIIVIDLRFYSESIETLLSENEEADILLIYNFDFLNEDNHFYKLMK